MLLKDIQPVFQSSPIPSLILSPDAPAYTIIYANPAFIKTINPDDISVAGKSIFSIIQPDLKNSDRVTLPSDQIYPIENDEGTVLYFVYTPKSFTRFLQEPIETTEVPDAEEQILSGSEQRFKSLVQEGSDLIAILSPDGKYLYVSPTSETVLSIKPEFFIEKNAFDFIHPDDLARITGEFSSLIAQGRIKISPYRFSIGNNEYRWIETIITDMTADPAVAGIVANSRDVTQEIERELKMKESIERFDMVSQATSDTIYDYNMLTAQVKWNKGIRGIFGYKKTCESTFNWWSDKVHPDDIERLAKGLSISIRNKNSRLKSEYRFKCADGSYKYVLDRSFIIYDEESVPVRMIGAMEDITEKISYIIDIEAQNVRLKEISWMQSHTVRAPLARLMGLTNLIRDEKGVDKQLLAHFSESAIELDKIIRSMINKAEHVSDKA